MLGQKRNLFLILGVSIAVGLCAFGYEWVYRIGYNLTLQNFQDFYAYYQEQLHFFAQGYTPYIDFPYAYPPLFLYLLLPFYVLGGNWAALPIELGFSLSAPLVYLVVRKESSEKIAVAAAFLYVLSPYFLLYEGLSWLSEQPMVFFLLLAIYLLEDGKLSSSAIAYGVAILLKQDAFFVLPAYLLLMIRTGGLRKTVYSGAMIASMLLVVSLPFLLLSPANYIGSITLGRLNIHYTLTSLLPSDQASGAVSIGAFSTALTNATLPNLSCAVITNNIFGLSEICKGAVGAGQTLTNWVFVPPSEVTQAALTALVLGLLLATLPELYFFRRRIPVTLLFAVSFAMFLIPLFLFGELAPYKYYLFPLYAILLVSCDDWSSLAIAAAVPVLTLVSPYAYFDSLLPVAELQFLIVNWLARRPSARVKPISVDGPQSGHDHLGSSQMCLYQSLRTTRGNIRRCLNWRP